MFARHGAGLTCEGLAGGCLGLLAEIYGALLWKGDDVVKQCHEPSAEAQPSMCPEAQT